MMELYCLQVTFSEKGTKITSQLHISKFEILSFSKKIHKNSDFQLHITYTLFQTEQAMKYFVFMDFIEETKEYGIGMSFLFLVTCDTHKQNDIKANSKNEMKFLKYIFPKTIARSTRVFYPHYYVCTVKLGFKNRQNKNLLDFKNQITNYQLVIYVVNYSQDKNILDFKNQNGSDRKSS